MDEIEIKDEFNLKNQCHTCLSIGRNLKPIGKCWDILKKLIPESIHEIENNYKKILICWECESFLKKAQMFQEQVQNAKELLSNGQSYFNGTLSNLTTVMFTDDHPSIIYINNTNLQTDVKHKTTPDLSEDDDFNALDIAVSDIKTENVKIDKLGDGKIKKTNRWAVKRAEKNRKPKFRIVDNALCYKKDEIGLEEFKQYVQEEACSENMKFKKYKCSFCLLSYSKDILLLKHLKECHKKNSSTYICGVCKKIFVNKRHLSAHIRKHYDKYSCLLCAYACYDKAEIKKHTLKNHKQVFECIKCKLKFGQRREFFKHYKEWHEKYICDICGISFKMRYCIKDHIRKQHSPFECKPCNKRFARYGGLWLHNKTRHSTATATAYCVECDTKYVDVYRYRWHLNNSARHKRERPRRRIPCPSCDKVFTKNIYMKDHYNLVHLKDYKYRCEECDKNFIRNADLVKHRRRVHEGILPPKNKICYMCGRGFTTRKILTNHLRTHTGERPYACACGARFSQSAALAAHARARGLAHTPADGTTSTVLPASEF